MGLPVALSSAILIALFAGQGQDTALPFDGIPNVRIERYPVAGRSVGAIRRAIDAARPTDPNDGRRVDGLSRWTITWRWRDDGRGNCRTTLNDLKFEAVVSVPGLADPTVPASVRGLFDRYLASLLAHEDGHIRYAWEHRGEVVEAMNAAGCPGIRDAGMTAVRRIGTHDAIFDKATNHGATTILPLR